MLNKASTNDDDGSPHHSHQQHVAIGDILLHCEPKLAIIQVVTRSQSITSSLTPDKPIIHRLSTNSSGTNNSQAIVPCDLKNISSTKAIPERIKSSSSSKKLIRMQKAGVALVKELKSKVTNSNHPESKTITINTNTVDERTQF